MLEGARLRKPLKRFLSWLWHRNDSYKCKRCGCVFPKKGARISGWSDHPYGFHVHCPRCGAVIDQCIKEQVEGEIS